jgi:ATP-binding cassette subfamily C protein CydD
MIDKTLNDILPLLAGFLGLALCRTVLSWASDVSAQKLTSDIKEDLRQRLIQHIFALGPSYTRKKRTGELISVLFEAVESLDAYFSQYIPKLALAVLIPISYLIFIYPLDITTALVLTFTAPLIPFFMILIGSATSTLTQRQWRALSRLSAQFFDILQGLTTLKIFNRSREQLEVIRDLSHRFRDSTMNILKVAFLSALVLEMVATISTAIVAVEIGLRLLYGRLGFDQALFALLLAPEFYLPLRALGARFHTGAAGVNAAKHIFEILGTEVQVPGTHHLPLLAKTSIVTFQNVHYQYTDRDAEAVKDVSFTLHPGKKTALVGPSGSGKSTIAELLMGFMVPTQGGIFLNDQPLERMDPNDWRSFFSYVPQSPYLFEGTILENIQLARQDASLEEIHRAAGLAQLNALIEELPRGYETQIGERGLRLSSGQAQRIALARAFLKDAPLLILDEATSHLDPVTEGLTRQAVNHLVENRAVLVIAHRLGAVMDADQILVMIAGQVQEVGTHEELIHREGYYFDMITAYRRSISKLDPGMNAPMRLES